MDIPDPDTLVRLMAAPLGGAILLNQLDELFIDANYFLRGLHRRSRRAVTLQALREVEQKRIAILVPAWQESDVIEQMLERNLAKLDYDRDRFEFFCGTYENDPETQACVDAVARRYPNVHDVVVPHDGPTCKADCLNWIYQGIVLEERRRGFTFDVLLMHDSEDVIHPLSLRLYSLLIPTYEFVQTPVFSLDLDPAEVVAGTYIDEFAEHHLKEMCVRQAIHGVIPSAGVGSAFDRRAFAEIARANDQQPFNPESLTEDYEIGLKFRLARKRVHFACYTVPEEASPGAPCAEQRAAGGREQPIATREYFPKALGASVRQRSRWILGITLQTWEQVGWRGSLPVLYCLWRDRKALFTNSALVLSYALVLYVVARSAFSSWSGDGWSAAMLIPPHTTLHSLLFANLLGFGWRAGMKFYFVRRLYGWRQGLLSIARLLAGNVISIAATARAVSMWWRHCWTGEPLRWLKTAHAFPTEEALAGAVEIAQPAQLAAARAARAAPYSNPEAALGGQRRKASFVVGPIDGAG